MASSLPNIMQPAQSDPLAQLRDIHLPATLDTYFIAPGWWLLATLILVSLAGTGYWLYGRWRRERYRKAGIRALKKTLTDFQYSQRSERYLSDFTSILKRVALARYPRESVASLTGEAWVNFLDRSYGGQEFSMGAGQVLIDGPYQPHQQVDAEALYQLGIRWIRLHNDDLMAELTNTTGEQR